MTLVDFLAIRRDIAKHLDARKRIPLRLRHRIQQPDQLSHSIFASVLWSIGIMQQDNPVSFYIKIVLLLALIISSIFHRIF